MLLILLSNRGSLYLPKTMELIERFVSGVTDVVIIDDSGDESCRAELNRLGTVVPVAGRAAGYRASMSTVFEIASGEEFLFWEEDFLPLEPIDVTALAATLRDRPYLSQIALMRRPWYSHEFAHGGLIGAMERIGHKFKLVDGLIEHRAFFTGNPCVIPKRTYSRGWPDSDVSEVAFAEVLLRDPEMRFGMVPKEVIEHVGAVQTGFDY